MTLIGSRVRSVRFNDGDGFHFALVEKDNGGGNLDLIVFKDGVSSSAKSVPHREPEDYGPEGGGRTWKNA